MCDILQHELLDEQKYINLEAVKMYMRKYEEDGDILTSRARKIFTASLVDYRDDKIDFDIVQKALELKIEYAKDILKGNTSIIIETDDYRKSYRHKMFKIFLDRLKETQFEYGDEDRLRSRILNYEQCFINDDVNMYYGKNVAQFLLDNITEEEIDNNAISKQIQIKKKNFNFGTKITKLLSYIAEHYDNDTLKNKVVGNFLPQKQSSNIILSAYPTAFTMAGQISDSCLSPNGDNLEGAIAAIGYPNTLVLHTSDFSWRAFVILDNKNKYYSVFTGYPRENYYVQIMTDSYLKNLGYKLVDPGYFHFPLYMSYDSIWPDDEMEKTEGSNYDSEYSWESSIFPNQNEVSIGSIVQVYRCESCEQKSFWPHENNGYCENCGDNRDEKYCESCDEWHDEDDMNFIPHAGQDMCEDCGNDFRNNHAGYYLKLARKVFTDLQNSIDTNNDEYPIEWDLNNLSKNINEDMSNDELVEVIFDYVNDGRNFSNSNAESRILCARKMTYNNETFEKYDILRNHLKDSYDKVIKEYPFGLYNDEPWENEDEEEEEDSE